MEFPPNNPVPPQDPPTDPEREQQIPAQVVSPERQPEEPTQDSASGQVVSPERQPEEPTQDSASGQVVSPERQPGVPLSSPAVPMGELPLGACITQLELPRESFGDLLLKARIDRCELCLEKAARKANVALGTLSKLETGDFHKIAMNPIFIQGAIQRLCVAYELEPKDVDAIMQAFERDWQQYAASNGAYHLQNDLAKDLETSVPKARQSLSAILLTILCLFLVVLIIGGYFYRTYQRNRLKGLEVDFDLPSIVEPPRLPLDAIPVPNS